MWFTFSRFHGVLLLVSFTSGLKLMRIQIQLGRGDEEKRDSEIRVDPLIVLEGRRL